MAISLVGQLKEAETYNDKIEQIRDRFLEDIRQYEKLPGYKAERAERAKIAEIASENLPQFDVDVAQRYLIKERIEGYQGEGSILNEAVQGRQTVEDTLEELSQVNSAITRYLPQFKDKEHNGRVKQLQELIDDRGIVEGVLMTDSVLSLSNTLAGAVYGVAIAFGITYGLALLNQISGIQVTPQEASNLGPSASLLEIAGLTSILVGGFGAAVGTFLKPSNRNLPRDNAKYLDTKIKELLL